MSPRASRNEGSRYQRQRDGRWIAAVTMPSGQRKTATRKTKGEAGEALRELLRQRDEWSIAGRNVALGPYLRRWAEGLNGLAPATIRQHRMIVRVHLAPAFERVKLQALTPSMVDRYLASRQDLDPQTRRHHRATLRRALRDAERNGMVVRNAAALSRQPRMQKGERSFLTGAQVKLLVDSSRTERLWPLWTLIVTTGLRVSEALGLAWSDVDLEGRRLRVRYELARVDGEWVLGPPKTPKSRRTIDLTAIAIDALRVQRATQDADRGATPMPIDGLVFTTPAGQPIHSSNVLPPFRRALAAAGLPKVTIHDLRHSAASMLAAQGVPLHVITSILGHSTIRITADLYAHVIPEMRREAADLIDEALS